jgi:hypothetical protein
MKDNIYSYQVLKWLKDPSNKIVVAEFVNLLEIEAEGEEIGFVLDCFSQAITNAAIPATEKRLARMKGVKP